MSKNRFPSHPKQQTPAMSPSHPHTVNGVSHPPSFPDEEDRDICPVCDGECTCSNNIRSSVSSHPLSYTPGSPAPSSSSMLFTQSSSPSVPKKPILKIKFTVPPALLNKHKTTSKNYIASYKDGEMIAAYEKDDGRISSVPVSSVTPTVIPKRRGRPPKTLVAARRAAQASNPISHKISRKAPSKKDNKILKTRTKRKRVETASSSELSDIDDSRPVSFPTFVSASALSSTADTSGDDSSEEESFILTEERLLARREQLWNVPTHEWTNRPRSQISAGFSDREMDVDTDSTRDDDEDEEDEADEADVDADGDGDGDIVSSPRYGGIAISWSDDEESSFDADIFFAGLSDSTDRDSSDSCSSDGDAGGDGDQSDLDSMTLAEAAASILPHIRRDLGTFDVTEGWDGQIVFTNGSTDLQAFLSSSLEPVAEHTHARQYDDEMDDDANMDTVTEIETDEEHYQDGDTTDEDLVGEDELPNEKAMRLFHTPFKPLSFVKPSSTTSLMTSPIPLFRQLGANAHSPSGGTFWDDLEDHEEEFDRDDSKLASNARGCPRRGEFSPVPEDKRHSILDDSHKMVPCAYPTHTFHRNRPSRSHSQSQDGRDLTTVRAIRFPRSISLPPSSSQTLSSSELSTDSPDTDLPLAPPIELDDVLDSSFLDYEPSDFQFDSPNVTPSDNGDRMQMKNLSRWDLISVGAFRKTRAGGNGVLSDTAGWGSDSANDYGTVMRSSPLSAMMWQNKQGVNHGHSNRKALRTSNLTISPVLTPQRDGDRTPTNASHQEQQHNIPKNRKELRRERKLKRITHGPVPTNNPRPHQHRHHYRQHHPNSKNRSSSQRSNFNSPDRHSAI